MCKRLDIKQALTHPAIFTKQGWSIKDLLHVHGKRTLFSCGTRCLFLSGQDRVILLAWVTANHGAGFDLL